jgi:hypothetical protein
VSNLKPAGDATRPLYTVVTRSGDSQNVTRVKPPDEDIFARSGYSCKVRVLSQGQGIITGSGHIHKQLQVPGIITRSGYSHRSGTGSGNCLNARVQTPF